MCFFHSITIKNTQQLNVITYFKNRCPNRNDADRDLDAFGAAFLSEEFSRNDWYVDLGASGHFVVNPDWLTNVLDNVKLQDIVTANKQRMPVSCVGNVSIETVVSQNSYNVTVKKVMCVLGLTTNLLSVSQLITNGNKVISKFIPK